MNTSLRITWTDESGKTYSRRFHIGHAEGLARETIEERAVEALARYLGDRRWESLSIQDAEVEG